MVKQAAEGSVEDVHRALSHSDRRHFLNELDERDEPFDITDPDIEHVDDGSVQVRVKFRHLHLPLLEEYDFVSWDKDRGTVAKGKRFDDLKPWLGTEAKAPIR